MKTKLTILGSLASLGAAASLHAQATSAVTAAVGYHTEDIVSGFNMIGVNVGNAVAASGDFESAGFDEGKDFTALLDDTLPYTLQNIVTGDIATVMSFDAAGNIVTDPVLAVTAGDQYEVRQDQTIGDLFGAANEAGLLEGTDASADLIWIPNGDATYTRVFYNDVAGVPPFGLGIGWRKVGGGATDAATEVIPFEYGIFVQRRGTDPLSLVFVGHVRGDDADQLDGHGATNTNIGLVSGFNAVNRVVPVSISLIEAGMDSILTAGTEATGDILWNPNGDATYSRYFMNNVAGVPPFGLGEGLRKIGGGATPADDDSLASGFLIQRRAADGEVSVQVPDRLDL